MPADPEMWQALFDHWRGIVAELRQERQSYASGAKVSRRPYKGEWVDITEQRIAQINREIESLENALKAHGQNA
jgi:hypothetical protein